MNQLNKNILCTSAFIILSLASAFSQNYIGDRKEIDSILENIVQFSGYIMASNYAQIGKSYTEDARIFPTNKDIIQGRESIIDYWTMPEGSRISYHKVTPIEIKIWGDEAYDYGYYEGVTTRVTGEKTSWRGKYVIVWRKTNEEWKIHLDIWNRIAD
jgi:ketosteroid isomerase-like protein